MLLLHSKLLKEKGVFKDTKLNALQTNISCLKVDTISQ